MTRRRAAALLIELVAVACGRPESPGRVIVLGLDGMEPRAAAVAPDDDVLLYNIGLVYRQYGMLDDAAAAFARAHAINPRGLPSRGRPRAADRLAEIEAARASHPDVR